MTGELHPSGGDDIIFYLRQEIQLLSRIIERWVGSRTRLLTTRRTILTVRYNMQYHSLVDREKMIGTHTTNILSRLILSSMLWR